MEAKYEDIDDNDAPDTFVIQLAGGEIICVCEDAVKLYRSKAWDRRNGVYDDEYSWDDTPKVGAKVFLSATGHSMVPGVFLGLLFDADYIDRVFEVVVGGRGTGLFKAKDGYAFFRLGEGLVVIEKDDGACALQYVVHGDVVTK